jgi:hypothetical protein
MAVETFGHIDSLNTANPTSSDPKSEGDDHLRGIKTALKNSFPNVTGAVTATQVELNALDGVTATTAELNWTDGVTSAIQTQIDTKQSATAEVSTPHVTLDAIAKTISTTANAVDIFIYDTSKDSDGGAWRKRTQHTSWYNEPDLPAGTGAGQFNSLTRSTRKEFPAVAVIVAEANKVTIYDGDYPSMPMWMVFNTNLGNWATQANMFHGNVSGVTALNGTLGHSGSLGLHTASFVEDNHYGYRASIQYKHTFNKKGIVNRNYGVGSHVIDTSAGIISTLTNDVAMTVLPNAPVDSTTLLPIPTIVVATDGGVSVIKDDGTVESFVHGSYPITTDIYFQPNSSNVFFLSGTNHHFWADVNNLATALEISANPGAIPSYWSSWTGEDKAVVTTKNRVRSHNKGVTFYKDYNENSPTSSSGLSSVAYMTSKYNTGYMTGDIRGAWNVDTDVTALSGTELISNGTFDADTDWIKGAGWTISGGVATSNGTYGTLHQSALLTPYATYSFTYTILNYVSGSIKPYSGSGLDNVAYRSGNGTYTEVVTVNSNGVFFYSNLFEGEIDNVSIREAIPDRSVKGNGLVVHGSPTVSAVATGAELKCISGFSTSNYLEQPYNSDLDFGTGDWSISGWVKSSRTSGYADIISRTVSNAAEKWTIQIYGNYGTVRLAYFDGTSWFTAGLTTSSITSNTWRHVTVTCTSGVYHTYIDGIKDNTASSSMNGKDMTFNAGQKLQLGWQGNYYNYPATLESLALWRISATAPTAEQIKEIYEAEKVLFQANAKCTLNGSSDAVTALAYDDDTELLHVGTTSSTGGRSTFQGLRRVAETSTSTTEIAAQGGLIVEETA